MKVLVTGATGFIGRHVAASLIAAGHEVLIGARDAARARRIFPDQAFVACDFTQDLSTEVWRPRLEGIEALVNCVGVLQPRRRATTEAVHVQATSALFDACAAVGLRRVIHVSALGVETGIDLAYATSKLAADRHLQGLDLDWTILRPSLVYTPAGSYGGTSMLRAQAALPFILPLPGKGEQAFQPVFMDDLTEGIRRLLEQGRGLREIIPVTGPEPLSIREILLRLRAWLGLGRAWPLPVPMVLMRGLARLGDLFGAGPLSTTSLRMIEQGNTAAPDAFTAATGIVPQSFSKVLAGSPAQVQDRWHAQLHFLSPLLRVSLGLMWVLGGLWLLIPYLPWFPFIAGLEGMEIGPLPLGPEVVLHLFALLSGSLLLLGWQVRWALGLQLAVVGLLSGLGLFTHWALRSYLHASDALTTATLAAAAILALSVTLIALVLENDR